mmetsp:Transcript_12730/g.21459  ORF Transcript_12730/g.21459 Transcript_12730/m.21459 type:complete len:225 (-) Transcript_12730:717-1391(-)
MTPLLLGGLDLPVLVLSVSELLLLHVYLLLRILVLVALEVDAALGTGRLLIQLVHVHDVEFFEAEVLESIFVEAHLQVLLLDHLLHLVLPVLPHLLHVLDAPHQLAQLVLVIQQPLVQLFELVADTVVLLLGAVDILVHVLGLEVLELLDRQLAPLLEELVKVRVGLVLDLPQQRVGQLVLEGFDLALHGVQVLGLEAPVEVDEVAVEVERALAGERVLFLTGH